MRKSFSLLASLLILVISNSGTLAFADNDDDEGQRITIYGTNNYPEDVVAVQSALDDYQYGTVVLSGIFDFGPDGGVQITRPNITLTATKSSPAIITGQGKFFDPPGSFYFWYLIRVMAPGVEISNLTLEGSIDTGILVFGVPNGNEINVHENSVTADWSAVFAGYNEGSQLITGNTLSSNIGVYCYDNRKSSPESDATLEISGNWIIGIGFYNTGVWCKWSWESRENGLIPPTYITDNTIILSQDGWALDAVAIGDSVRSGGTDVTIERNVIQGRAIRGMFINYSENSRIVDNDFSGLATSNEQVAIWQASKNLISGNTFGPCNDPDPVYGERNGVCVLLLNMNAHPNFTSQSFPDGTRYGWTEKNRIFDNNYEYTNMTGFTGERAIDFWNLQDRPIKGAILLATAKHVIGDGGYQPSAGLGLRKNQIDESNSKFPTGTSWHEQIFLDEEYEGSIFRTDGNTYDLFDARTTSYIDLDGEGTFETPILDRYPVLTQPATDYLNNPNKGPAYFQKQAVLVMSPYSDFTTTIYMRNEPVIAYPQKNKVD